jgi:hypothetical protein
VNPVARVRAHVRSSFPTPAAKRGCPTLEVKRAVCNRQINRKQDIFDDLSRYLLPMYSFILFDPYSVRIRFIRMLRTDS